MKKDILRIISESRQFKLLQEAPTPRWVIFALDMLIVALASLMVLPYNLFGVSGSSGLYVYSLFLGVYAIMNLIVGAYKCIVRLSMPYDLLKVFWCVFLSSVIITAISVSYGLLTAAHHPLLGIVPVILIGTMVMSLMMSLRIVVKYMFIHLSRVASRRERVIVLGTSIDSLAVAMTLKDEPRGQFIPVALLTIGDRHKSDTIQGLPVEQFDPNRLEQIFRRHDTNTLIFLNSQTPLMRSGMAEHFINSHIRLRVINQVDEFDVDKESESANISAHVNAVKIEDLLGRQVIKTDSRRVAAALKDSTVLITGAAGSIGSEIVRQVASFGAGKIILLDQAETPMHDLQLEMESKFPDIDIVLYVADVQNRERLRQAFRQYSPRYVFHAAAYKHVPMMERNPSEAILTNVMGTKNLADLSLQWGVRKFVMVSTDKAVNPTNIMGASKRIAEIYVQSLFFQAARDAGDQPVPQFITTRFGNVLGSNGSVIPLFRRQIEAGGPVTVTHKDIIRYFMTIKEACSLVLEAGCMGHGGEIFLFDMGEPVKIYDLARRMILLAGLKPGVDIEIKETGLRPGEKLYEELLNDKETTIPTDNDKIMIAKVREYDFMAVLPHIETMIQLAKEGNIHDMVMSMKGLVPEYISNNSVFQQIDAEMRHTAPAADGHQSETTPPIIQ
jgi:FlaA1/EpsC-like NDP-sugar epimerase